MDYLMWGATGQARVVRPILEAQGHTPVVLIDRRIDIPSPFRGLVITPPDELDTEIGAQERALGFIVAIGGQLGKDRDEISRKLVDRGLAALSVVHSSSCIGETASLGIGSQVLMGACIGEGATLGDFCIINTAASVDHDCRLGNGVHVMPGATVAGEVRIGDFATVGIKATVLPRLTIGEGAVIGAGAVVTRDVEPGATWSGFPSNES